MKIPRIYTRSISFKQWNGSALFGIILKAESFTIVGKKTRLLEPHLIHNIEQREETIYAPNFEDEDDYVGFISDSELVRIGLNQLCDLYIHLWIVTLSSLHMLEGREKKRII